MSTPTQEAVLAALSAVQDPDLNRDVVSLGFVKNVVIDGGKVSFTLNLTTPACPLKDQLKSEAEEAVRALPGVESVEVELTASVRTLTADALGTGGLLPDTVKNVVLVGSGKGGVGKSTVAVNLAAALRQMGASVGLLDADVYGPSIPIMLGIANERPTTSDGQHLDPLEAHGIKTMSIGFLVEPDQAMIWRGPMLVQAITQFLRDVTWGELDYLVIDLPPGTGDVQLSLAQQVRAAGGVLVTTPQDVALADVRKAKHMMDKVEIPVLGLVENMSYFVCPHCHEETDVFDRGGGERAAAVMEIPFLGAIPLNAVVRRGGDVGVPFVLSDPESHEAKAMMEVARQVAHRVSVASFDQGDAAPALRMA